MHECTARGSLAHSNAFGFAITGKNASLCGRKESAVFFFKTQSIHRMVQVLTSYFRQHAGGISRWALGTRREARQNLTTYVPPDDSGASGDSCAIRPPDWGWALEVFRKRPSSFLALTLRIFLRGRRCRSTQKSRSVPKVKFTGEGEKRHVRPPKLINYCEQNELIICSLHQFGNGVSKKCFRSGR